MYLIALADPGVDRVRESQQIGRVCGGGEAGDGLTPFGVVWHPSF